MVRYGICTLVTRGICTGSFRGPSSKGRPFQGRRMCRGYELNVTKYPVMLHMDYDQIVKLVALTGLRLRKVKMAYKKPVANPTVKYPNITPLTNIQSAVVYYKQILYHVSSSGGRLRCSYDGPHQH